MSQRHAARSALDPQRPCFDGLDGVDTLIVGGMRHLIRPVGRRRRGDVVRLLCGASYVVGSLPRRWRRYAYGDCRWCALALVERDDGGD